MMLLITYEEFLHRVDGAGFMALSMFLSRFSVCIGRDSRGELAYRRP